MESHDQSINVMEKLVEEEVERQLQNLPCQAVRYINPAQVLAYALNRLPALYVTSERGWQQQWQRGKTELQQQITTAVRQGFAAVQRDPLRRVSLMSADESGAAELALQDLKALLRRNDLDWSNVVSVVEQTLIKTARGEVSWRRQGLNTDLEYFDWDSHPLHQRVGD